MVVAAVYLFVSCYTAGLSLEAVNDNTEVGLSNNTRLLQSPSYDPFFQRRIKKQQAESNITLGVGGRLFQSEWNEEGSCFLYFIIIFLAFFIMLGLFTFIICYSYGWNKLLYGHKKTLINWLTDHLVIGATYTWMVKFLNELIIYVARTSYVEVIINSLICLNFHPFHQLCAKFNKRRKYLGKIPDTSLMFWR